MKFFFFAFFFLNRDPIGEDREHDVDVLKTNSSQVTHRRHCIWLSSNLHDQTLDMLYPTLPCSNQKEHAEEKRR